MINLNAFFDNITANGKSIAEVRAFTNWKFNYHYTEQKLFSFANLLKRVKKKSFCG